jgi:hypothetical protein
MRYLYVKYHNPISYGSKDKARLKFFKTRSKFKIKVTRSKVLVPRELSFHEVSICKQEMFVKHLCPPWTYIIGCTSLSGMNGNCELLEFF